jgi:hypothetical protein
MLTNYLVLDLSTAAVEGVTSFITPAADRTPPKNYSKPESIATWQAEAVAEDIAKAALDLDLARVTGMGLHAGDTATVIVCKTDEHERILFETIATRLRGENPMLVSYNGLGFDWPLLMRRARYLGVDFPDINCDRYRSPHVDLLAKLSGNDPSRRKALGWYVRRLGWTDLSKPLTGAEEAQVPQTGRWDELRASLAHDVEATVRLARWMGIIN